MRILIAPNAYKGALDAVAAAEAIAAGLAASPLVHESLRHPVADGGDGTAALLVRHLGGEIRMVDVQDPLGRPVSAPLGLANGGRTALLGIADASGLRLLDAGELDPRRASSFGTGQLIRHALDQGAREILLGLGGSATVDGAMGMLAALGGRFLDASGDVLPSCPERLPDLAAIDIDAVPPLDITLLCDVLNPLVGEDGAAAVFGPQKGATPDDVALLDVGLARLADVILHQTGKDVQSLPRGGAAGGVAAVLHALVGARIVSGIDHFLDVTGFDRALAGADLVITGEGAIDLQTLSGKAPHGVAIRAKALGLPVIALAGRVPLKPDPALSACFDVLLAIGNGPVPLAQAMAETEANLHRIAQTVGTLLARARG